MGNMAVNCINNWGQDIFWSAFQRSTGWVPTIDPDESPEDIAVKPGKDDINKADIFSKDGIGLRAKLNKEVGDFQQREDKALAAAGFLLNPEELAGNCKDGSIVEVRNIEDEKYSHAGAVED